MDKPVKRVPIFTELNFDKPSSALAESVGITQEDAKRLYEEFGELGESYKSKSEVVQLLYENFSMAEISFLVHYNEMQHE